MTAATFSPLGFQQLQADLQAQFERRLSKPASVKAKTFAAASPIAHDEAQAVAIDEAVQRWKDSGGPARDNERRALDLQIKMQHATGQYLNGGRV